MNVLKIMSSFLSAIAKAIFRSTMLVSIVLSFLSGCGNEATQEDSRIGLWGIGMGSEIATNTSTPTNGPMHPINPSIQWVQFLGILGATTTAYRATSDSLGNTYTTGYTDGNLDGQNLIGKVNAFIVKYDSTGHKQWTRLLGGGGNTYTTGNTTGYGIAADTTGNVYVTGYTNANTLDDQNKTGYQDAFIVKYDADGNKQWTKLLGGSGTTFSDGSTEGRGVTSDANGNVYITGYTNVSILSGQTRAGNRDAFVVKYDSAGNQQWIRLLGDATGATRGRGIASDAAGNIYVTGATSADLNAQTKIGYEDAFVVKYDRDGNAQWTRLSGVSVKSTVSFEITLDANVNILITGNTAGALDGQIPVGTNDAFVIKYDNDGNKQWTKLFGDDSFTYYSAEAIGWGIVTDALGNVYVAGQTTTAKSFFASPKRDMFLVKYDSEGSNIWSKLQLSADVTYCQANAYGLALGIEDSIYIAGGTSCLLDFTKPSLGINSLFVIRYLQ